MAARLKTTSQKVNQNEKAEIMSQMKREDKVVEKQLNEVEVDNLPEKIILNNDSEDDPRSWKKNGDNAINIY